ncbi:MAG: beta-propeller domain-containing protein [Methanolinea sp.]|nr:beta-propeller domain-containing protein [Methanolinea sp.]
MNFRSGYGLGLLLLCGIVVVAIIVGLALQQAQTPVAGNGGMKKFQNLEELSAYLSEKEQSYTTGSGQAVMYEPPRNSGPGDAVVATGMEKSTASPAAIPMPTGGTHEYSTTNVQVRGVDEADFIKSDGEYFYLITGGELVIVDAYPPGDAHVLSRTSIEGQPVDLYIQDGRVMVMTSGNDEQLVKPASSAAPVPVWRTVTHANIFDFSDRSHPRKDRDVEISGNYVNSRLIGGYAYLITSEPARWYGKEPVVPTIREGDGSVVTPDIYYPDIPISSFQYYTISSVSIAHDTPPQGESFLAGYSTTVYVSQDNFYLAYQKDLPVTRWRELKAVSPVEDVSSGQQLQGTLVHRFSLDSGRITYEATGDVPGYLLNQFSLDEYGDHLRVATTVQGYDQSRSYQYNSVYILSMDMELTGRLEYIAPEEQIYAARFMGDRLYLVTFKRVDPFFVIDLSDPKNPAILGKLKIPGYSDYLHPYDENHVIGLGKETEANQWGGVSVSGLKLALFDVSDVNNPILVDKVEIGEAGTDSEALRDHRAFLFSREKNLLVIPVREVVKVPAYKNSYESYTQEIWQGAYVFGINPESGFILRGRVDHNSGEPYSGYYWDYQDSVRRSLYIEDTLYTISYRQIIATSLDDLDKRLKEIDLPYSGYGYGGPYRIA